MTEYSTLTYDCILAKTPVLTVHFAETPKGLSHWHKLIQVTPISLLRSQETDFFLGYSRVFTNSITRGVFKAVLD